MPAKQGVAGAENFILQEAISAYADEAYTNARKLSGTGIVGSNDKIDTSTETFIGQVRWNKPMNPTINIASLTDPTKGVTSSYGMDMLTYVKTVRTYGGTKVNMQEVVTQTDGLAKVGRDFAEHRAQDEHNAILAVLRGVAASEVLLGAGSASGQAGLGGQTFDNDPQDKRYGFYVDLGAQKLVTAATAANQGAQRAEGFLQAFGMAYKDYEPEWAYLIATPETIASLRSANLVDQDKVVDGNIKFDTIFQGKLRLIQTRATQGFSQAELALINGAAGVNIAGTKTSFIVLPGAIALKGLSVPSPVEIERDASAYQGGGTTTIWNRWGFVLAPAGYNWAGDDERFASDAHYQGVVDGADFKSLATATSGLADVKGTWERKTASALTLGILPVFHS